MWDIFSLLWEQGSGTGLSSMRSAVRIRADHRHRDAFAWVERRRIAARKDPGVRRDQASVKPLQLMGYATDVLIGVCRTCILSICSVLLRLVIDSTRGSTGHLFSGLDLGLVTDGQPLQMDQKFWPALFEEEIVEVVQVSVSVFGRPVEQLPEAVQVELSDETGEVGGLEEFSVLFDR